MALKPTPPFSLGVTHLHDASRHDFVLPFDSTEGHLQRQILDQRLTPP
jgi:hypothetical protein